jgi:hypothetical protein
VEHTLRSDWSRFTFEPGAAVNGDDPDARLHYGGSKTNFSIVMSEIAGNLFTDEKSKSRSAGVRLSSAFRPKHDIVVRMDGNALF